MRSQVYKQALAGRMKAARVGAGYTQEQVASWLGIEVDAYRKQEKAGALPNYLFEDFAAITGVNVTYLLTGKHPAEHVPLPTRLIG
ncbi:MAG: helix-turn-helix domain-containing protein [Hyphomicrobiales bacterium]